MKSNKRLILSLPMCLLLGATLLLAGCRTGGSQSAAATETDAGATVAMSGAQVWANNCARCHNFRSPASYSDAEWDVAMHHMRLRANLTAEEHRSIVEFLKSAN